MSALAHAPAVWDLTGKRALVTDGDSEEGFRIAMALCEAGAWTQVVFRDHAICARRLVELRERGLATGYCVDVCSRLALDCLAQELREHLPKLHILVTHGPLASMKSPFGQGLVDGALYLVHELLEPLGDGSEPGSPARAMCVLPDGSDAAFAPELVSRCARRGIRLLVVNASQLAREQSTDGAAAPNADGLLNLLWA